MSLFHLPRNDLATKIHNAERRLAFAERRFSDHATLLGQKLCRRMTAPASLLLAGGVGFAFGELTRNPAYDGQDPAARPGKAGVSALKTVLDLIATARTLYAGLVPLALIIKSSRQRGAAKAGPCRRSVTQSAKGASQANR